MTPDGFDLVVFDRDGVLVDSEVIAVRADQRVLADLGWALEREEIVERFVGRAGADCIATVKEQLGIELGEGCGQVGRDACLRLCLRRDSGRATGWSRHHRVPRHGGLARPHRRRKALM